MQAAISRIDKTVAQIASKQTQEIKEMSDISDAVGDLVTTAAKIEGTEDSALVVLNGLKDQLAAALANAADAATAVVNVRQVIAGMTTHNEPLASAIATPPTP